MDGDSLGIVRRHSVASWQGLTCAHAVAALLATKNKLLDCREEGQHIQNLLTFVEMGSLWVPR